MKYINILKHLVSRQRVGYTTSLRKSNAFVLTPTISIAKDLGLDRFVSSETYHNIIGTNQPIIPDNSFLEEVVKEIEKLEERIKFLEKKNRAFSQQDDLLEGEILILKFNQIEPDGNYLTHSIRKKSFSPDDTIQDIENKMNDDENSGFHIRSLIVKMYKEFTE